MKLLVVLAVCVITMIEASNVCRRGCQNQWSSFYGNRDPEEDGVLAGQFKEAVPSYIGRTHFDGQYVPGRIQTTSPYGLYHPSSWKVHHITSGVEYLVNNPNYEYTWVDSMDGEYVANAVIPGYTHGRTIWLIGRIQVDDFTYLGKVQMKVGLNYEDGNNAEVFTNKYQVLVCACK